ncbi:hypothetical protein GCM10010389_58430 [Streptomyces echinoruber]|uniref:Uncharacterized protein n=1 Tax=Streptomyces echinoruber TaxID=68898 RepID=A0A918VNN1_9ACTN|nr:hypothetical protein GCM10010389_58430 [Streptomyces echinoruber]
MAPGGTHTAGAGDTGTQEAAGEAAASWLSWLFCPCCLLRLPCPAALSGCLVRLPGPAGVQPFTVMLELPLLW